MKLDNFKVERYFAKYEFKAKYLLSSSDCDGFSMDYVLGLASNDELNSWNNLKLGYTETRGSDALREAIKQHYTTINFEDIVVSSPGELNFSLMNVLLEAGDEVVYMAPMYQSLYQVAKNIKCTLKIWEPEIKNNTWYYNPNTLADLVSSNTKLIVVNFPHNPTGYSPDINDLQAIVNIAKAHNIYLFSDEMYRFLHHNEDDVIPSVCDLYENAISLWGCAKTFGLAGLRLGWLTSKNSEILSKVENFKDYLSICSSATSEILATIALNNLDSFLQPNLNKIKSNISIFEDFVNRNSNVVSYYKPNSGSTTFAKLNLPIPTLQFTEQLVKDTGIMMLPSETFEYGTSHVRIGFGRQNFKDVLLIFEDYITK